MFSPPDIRATCILAHPVMGWVVTLLLISLSPSADATVYKCASADGKTTFSDKACPMAPPAAAIGRAPSAAPSQPTPPTPRSGNPNDAKHRADCFQQRDRIADLMENGFGATPPAEVRTLITRFEAQCADVAQQEMRRHDVKEAAANAPLRQAQDAARSSMLRKEVGFEQLEQQALSRQGTPLTPAQTQQRSAFSASVAKECG